MILDLKEFYKENRNNSYHSLKKKGEKITVETARTKFCGNVLLDDLRFSFSKKIN